VSSQIRVIAAVVALAAFAVAVVAGMASGREATGVLVYAILATALCFVPGLAAGAVFAHVVREHLATHEVAQPIPSLSLPVRETTPAQTPPVGRVFTSQKRG